MPLKRAQKKRIFVGLSGGVDSSVSALLLQKQGYDVTGVFIKVWQPDFLTCTWQDDRRDAMRICAHLNIPFKTLDLSDVYKREVVDNMLTEYKKGRTPNPDIMCNRSVKFGAFLDFAKKEGADAVATGHYAQIFNTKGELGLYSSADVEKDQTYFLWQLKGSDLRSIIFPVGHLEKRETRKIASEGGLVTAEKSDSQGLCFLGKLDMKEFLSHFIDEKQGDVLLRGGEKIGKHRGVIFYTLGERHGFTITKSGIKGPLYVIEKNNGKNQLIVDSTPFCESISNNVTLTAVNWIGEAPLVGKMYLARIRHRGNLLPVVMKSNHEKLAKIEFSRVESLIAKGQSIVLYEARVDGKEGLRCVGGGIVL